MRRAHPRFDDLIITATGPMSVYASFLEKGLSHEVNGLPNQTGGQMSEWRHFKIGLIVTGKGEAGDGVKGEGLPQFLRELAADGRASFTVIGRVGQLTPTKARLNLKPRVVLDPKLFSSRDAEIGAMVKAKLRSGECDFVILLDDLEREWRPVWRQKFERYLDAGRMKLTESEKARFSVHFLLNMMEAYFFADPSMFERIAGVPINSPCEDVEEISHPKELLKKLYKQAGHQYREAEDAPKIVRTLKLKEILEDQNTCRSLRSLVAWCVKAKGDSFSSLFQLADGKICPITGTQLETLPP